MSRKLPFNLRDFLDPIWRYSIQDKYSDNDNVNFNYLILKAIDKQLNQVEDKTIRGKAELYLKSAHDEYLDYWGSWFGLERLGPGETDNHYRRRIINHVKHPRSTIPALRRAISAYLHNHMRDVHIYEPWRDVFLSNDYASRTNGRAHFNGYYYRPAIINIYIDTHFDSSVVDMINWFRPVGTIFLLTYDSGPHSDVWQGPGVCQPVWQKSQVKDFIGFDDEECHDLNFLDPVSSYQDSPFYVSGLTTPDSILFSSKYHNFGVPYKHYLPLSRLNSKDVLIDPLYFGKEYYSYLATAHNLINARNNDTLNDLLLHSNILNPDIYPQLNEQKGLKINVTHRASHSNLVSHSLDLKGWTRLHHTYLTGLSDKGKTAVAFTANGSEISYKFNNLEGQNPDINKHALPNLVQANNSYYLGFDAKSSNDTSNVHFQIKFDNQTVDFYGTVYPYRWTHFTKKVILNETPKTISFVMKSRPEIVGDVYFTTPYLGEVPNVWQPSLQDMEYIAPNYKTQYNYAFINIWAYYFKYIESRNDVYKKLSPAYGIAPTPTQINKYIGKQFNHKSFSISYKPLTQNEISTRAWFMNFAHHSWINYSSHLHMQGNQFDSYVFNFGNLANMINNHGLMVFALETPCFAQDYKLEISYLNVKFCHYYPNKASIRLFKDKNAIEHWCDLTVWHIFRWASEFNYDNRSRSQAYYPIRYIRNWIRNISFGGPNDIRFITNDSNLNGHKLITDYEASRSGKAAHYIRPYWDYHVLPSYTDQGNPVKSLSILGVSCGDNYPTNRLNNLLKNSVFGYFSHPIWGHSKLTYMKKDINSEHVWFNNSGSKLWTSTDSIGARNHYVLTFNARAKHRSGLFLVKIELHSNRFTQTLHRVIEITPNRKVYNLEFNTYGVFPDTVRFVWEYLGDDIERFIHLKWYHTTFQDLFNGKYTYEYLLEHIIPKYSKDIDPVKFKHLKQRAISFDQMKKGHYTFRYLLGHIYPEATKDKIWGSHPAQLLAFDRRPDNVYLPDEPVYVFSTVEGIHKVPKPIENNKDIDAGWNFNGELPEDYYPCIFKKDNQMYCGYIRKQEVAKISDAQKRICFVPDGKGDYALGYNFYGKIKNWSLAYLEDVHTGKFHQVYGPNKFTMKITPNVKTAEIMFRDISCHLLTRVTVDGKDTAHVSPQINFKGEDTVAYNDIQFGQALNTDDIGESFGDLARYRNTFSEFKNFGFEFQYILKHIVLNDSDLTWQNFEKRSLTWKYTQQNDWDWLPNTFRDPNTVKSPIMNTTYGDLLHVNMPETFNDLLQNKNTFAGTNLAQLTFEDLHNFYNAKNQASPYYSYEYAKTNNWIFADGEPFDTKEHCVTVDLGRVYTNIDHLLVQHGSDSVPNAVYDSCVQTSIDGKHWHTWYDNYRGAKWPLDEPYAEPRATPVAIPIGKYDCFNSIRDFGKDNKVPRLGYVSAHLTHWPTKELSNIVFHENRLRVPLYLQHYWSTDHCMLQIIPSLHEMQTYKANEYYTQAGLKDMSTSPDRLTRVNNTDKINVMEYPDENNDTSSNYYYPKVPVVIRNKFNIPNIDKENMLQKLFSGHGTPTLPTFRIPKSSNKKKAKKHTNYLLYLNSKNNDLNSFFVLDGKGTKDKAKPDTTRSKNTDKKAKQRIITFYHHVLFTNDNNRVLNSSYVLQYGRPWSQIINHNPRNNPQTPNKSAGTIPNPPYSQYNYDTMMLKFNLSKMVTKHYPNIYHSLKDYGIKNTNYFIQNLFKNCSTLRLFINGTSNHSWNISLWDFKKQSWQHTLVAHNNGLQMLKTSDFRNCLDQNDNIYALIIANDDSPKKVPVLKIKSVDLALTLNMNAINDFEGGMYPHLNFEYNTNKLYSLEPSGTPETVKMPWIYKSMLGHKVTVSFNLFSSTEGNSFDLKIGDLHSGNTPIEKGFQNFHFVFDIPGRMNGNRRKNLTPQLSLPYNLGHIKIYGLKAELGVHLSPYCFPRNYIINE